MKSILLVVFSFFTLIIFAQKNELTKDSDTTHYYKYEKVLIEKMRLIKPEENRNFFRFSSYKYHLELADDSNRYLIYGNEIWDGKRTGKIFIKQIDLTEKQVDEIKKLISFLKIHNLPSDNQIKDWALGFDGITYTFELKDGNNYSYKHYWTPSSQQKFLESNTINFFVTKIDAIIDYRENEKKFTREIPYFAWNKDGASWSVMKVINKENYSEYKRYKRLMKKNKP